MSTHSFEEHTPAEQEIIVDQSLDRLIEMMEEMANAPKEEYGKREPGERQASEIYADRVR